MCHVAGQAWATIEEEPIEELGCSSEAEPIRQDCTPPGASAPGLPLHYMLTASDAGTRGCRLPELSRCIVNNALASHVRNGVYMQS